MFFQSLSKSLKRVRFAALPLLALSVALTMGSCEEEVPDIPGLPASGTLTAKVDGSDFDANVAAQASGGGGVLSIMGSNMVGRAINITLSSYTGPGTYAFGGLANTSSALWQETLTSEGGFSTFGGPAGIGEIVITSDDGTTVEGTFFFTGRNSTGDTRSVTEGTFTVPWG
jgi:hypothetical protein